MEVGTDAECRGEERWGKVGKNGPRGKRLTVFVSACETNGTPAPTHRFHGVHRAFVSLFVPVCGC